MKSDTTNGVSVLLDPLDSIAAPRSMFKIIENDDGSTTVYCNDTGRILCSVPRKRDKPLAEIQHSSVLEEKPHKITSTLPSKKKRPKAIGRPIPREVDPNQPRPMVSNGQPNNRGYSPLQCNIRPLAWANDTGGVIAEKCEFKPEDDIAFEQDINEDCISQPDFLQILNLCPKELAHNDGWKKLREDLPTRMIARPSKKPFVSTSEKILEYDIATPLFLRWLKETPEGQKKTLTRNGALMSIKKYETFCKFAIGSPYVSGSVSPYSMRFREMKDNVTFKPMKAQVTCHKYCFTKQQRAERRIAVETGLNKRSRVLQGKVLKNNMSLHIKLLSKEEVEKWTRYRPQTFSSVKLVNCKLGKSSKPGPKKWLKPGGSTRKSCLPQNSFDEQKSPQLPLLKPCKVKLEDVSKKLEFKDHVVYVRDTSIRVEIPAAMSEYLLYCHKTRHSGGSSPRHAELHDHPYHRLMPYKLKNRATLCKTKGVIKTAPSQNERHCHASKMNELNKKLRVDSGVSPSSTASQVQLIDISGDDGGHIVPMTQSLPLLSSPLSKFAFVFKCFGCNLKKNFKTKKVATSCVKEHMVTYHAVTEPKAFLSIHINKESKILLIEAFPGYKQADSM